MNLQTCYVRNKYLGNTKHLITFIYILQEVEQLRQEKLEIDQKLRNMHTTNSIGSNQGYPVRRNDR